MVTGASGMGSSSTVLDLEDSLKSNNCGLGLGFDVTETLLTFSCF